MENVVTTTVLDAKALAIIIAAVVGFVEIAKFGGLPQRFGVLAVVVFSIIGVLTWAYSYSALTRENTFDLFAGIANVMVGSAGVYGFVRAATPAQLTSTHRPPPAAGEG